jgi:YVTN family beta-propeller protein
VPFSIQVQLVDGSGNPLKIPFGAFVTASLATGPSGAVLSGTQVVGTNSTGLASFTNLIVDRPGSYTLTFTNSVKGCLPGTTGSFDVDGIDHFTFSAIPNPQALGVAEPSITLTALDAGSNVLTGYLGTVTLTSTDPKALLPGQSVPGTGPGTYTFVPADNGVHTFASSTFQFFTAKSGPQSFTAKDTVVVTATGTVGTVLQPGSLAGSTATPVMVQSTAIGLTGDEQTLVNVNPSANSVTVFDVSTPNTPVKVTEITVGTDPRNVAVRPQGDRAYVTNSADGTVSVVDLFNLTVTKTIPVGVEPVGCCLTPNGTKLYVANEISNSVSVIDTTSDTVTTTIDLSGTITKNGQVGTPLGTHPRAIGITNNGDTTDTDETVFVAMFFGVQRKGAENSNLPKPSNFLDEGQDDERDGHVVAISVSADTVFDLALLSPMAPSVTAFGGTGCGFTSNGSVLPAVYTTDGTGGLVAAGPANPPNFTTFVTGCYPNQLASIAIKPKTTAAYVVSTAASPNGPFRFDSNVQGLVSVFDSTAMAETVIAPSLLASLPLNLNFGVANGGTNNPKIFYSNPVAMAWEPTGSVNAGAWIVCQQGDVVVRVVPPSGGATVSLATSPTGAALTTTGTIQHVDLTAVTGALIPGLGPRGIVINRAATRAFVNCFTSRTVSVIDISTNPSPVTATAYSTTNGFVGGVPANGPTQTLLGAQLFYSGRGPQGRMSKAAWGACIVCHPDGLSDNVTWMFDTGPRQTIPLDATFAPPHDATAIQRIMNWSAVRDEVQDFELNTRNVFGGRGLIDDDRCFYLLGGEANGTDASVFEQFQQFLATTATSPVADTTNDDLFPTQPFGLTSAFVGFGFPRRDFAATCLPDGKIIFIGGRAGGTFDATGVTTAQATGGLITGTNMVVEFDPKTNLFTAMNSFGLPATGLICAGAATVKTKAGIRVYVIGGYTGSPGTAANLSAGNFVFDPSVAGTPPGSNWLQDAVIPNPVAQFGICTTGGFNAAEPVQVIHCVLGTTGNEGTASAVSNPNFDAQIFTPSDNPGDGTAGTVQGQWRPVRGNGRLTPRSMLGAAAVVRGGASHVIVIGGVDATGTPLNTVEDYIATPTTLPELIQVNALGTANAMTSIPGITLAGPNGPGAGLANFGIATSLTENKIYLFGGKTKNTAAAIVESNQILELTTNLNPGVTASNQSTGAPQGVWKAVGTLTVDVRQGFAVATPPAVANFEAQPSGGRSAKADAIAAWVQQKVRSYRGIQDASLTASIANGRHLFDTVASGGLGCVICHGGPNWTRSTVDYGPLTPTTLRPAPGQAGAINNYLSLFVNVSGSLQSSLGPEEIAGAELVRTNTAQGEVMGFANTATTDVPVPGTGVTTAFPGPTTVFVLNTVTTFEANGGTQGRINEKRFNGGDPSQLVNGLGADGFNIPSLLSVGGTAPYFYNGLAATLDNVIDGTLTGLGVSTTNVDVHRVPNVGTNRADLVNFLKSIDSTTTPFP